MHFQHISPHYRVWRYVDSDETFIQLYGVDTLPPDEPFPLACYQVDEYTIITMSEEEAIDLFFDSRL